MLDHLILLTFLGLETDEGRFEYADSQETRERIKILANRAEPRLGRSALYSVHPAYRPYLEIPDPG